MKKIKTIIAFVLMLCMVLSNMCTFTAFADEPKKLVDLDISNYVKQTGAASAGKKSGIVDNGTSTTAEFVWTSHESYSGYQVTAKESMLSQAGTTEYLDFNMGATYENWPDRNSRRKIYDKNFAKTANTISFWVDCEGDSTASPVFRTFFGYAEDYGTESTNPSLVLYQSPSTNHWNTTNGDGGDIFDVSAYGKWKHVVIVNPEYDANGKKTMLVYVNGKLVADKELAIPSGKTKDNLVNDKTGLYFGGRPICLPSTTYATMAIHAKYADIAVYEGELTEDEIKKIYNDNLPRFTPGEVQGVKFVDENGDEAVSLNKLTDITLKYTSLEDKDVWLVAACYDSNGSLITAFDKTAGGSDEIALSIPQGTVEIKGFVWDKSTLTPYLKAISVGYTDGYDPGAVKASSDFYDNTGSVIRYMSGKTGIYAKANVSSLIPPENMTAELKLVRNGENVFCDDEDVVFTGREAEISVALGNVSAQDGDELVFTLYDSKRTYLIKKLKYADLSSIVDVILIAGQSNALGQGGSYSQSIKPEAGTVYNGNMNTPHTGNQGWDSALGKTWHDETGHTVLIVKATWGGTGFPTKPNLETGVPAQWGSSAFGYWNPDNEGSTTAEPYDCYTLAKEKYAKAVASIDTNKYIIGDCIYFWNQGENENNSYTAQEYEEAFMELHNKFTTEFGTEETRITHGGILPVRSSYSNGFPNLKLTGPRIAQYNMAKKNDDIFIVSDATEHWYSDASIKEWFAKKYDGIVYPLDKIPASWTDIMNDDNVHYKQAAMNEMGEEAAINMLSYLKGNNTPDGIDLITPSGIVHLSNGDGYTLTSEGAIPVIPASVGAKASFSVSGDAATIDTNGVIKPSEALLNDYAILTATLGNGSTMTFKLYSPLVDDRINISPIKDNKSAIYSLTTDDNYAYTNKWIDGKLSEYGMVATMGLITDSMGNSGKLTWQEAQGLVATGRWGVANHTKAHRQAEFASLTEAELDTEINGGRDVLVSYFPNEKLLAMYTPGGITSTLIRNKVRENHHILRGAGGGNNSLPISESSMLALKSQAIYSDTTLDKMNAWIDSAISNGEWVVEMWHGVGNTDAASWGGNTTEEIADSHIKYVSQKSKDGILWVTTLDEAAVYMIQRLKSQIHIVSETEDQLVFTLTDELDDTIYDSALTVNIPIAQGYTSATVSQNGKTVNSVNKDGVVSITIKPNGGNITVDFTR